MKFLISLTIGLGLLIGFNSYAEEKNKPLFDEKEGFLFVFQKAINHPSSGNSQFVHTDCKKVDLEKEYFPYGNKEIKELREKKRMEVQYVEELKETSSYFYVIENVSRKYGDEFTYIESTLWGKTKKDCESMVLEVKTLTEKSAISYHEYLRESKKTKK